MSTTDQLAGQAQSQRSQSNSPIPDESFNQDHLDSTVESDVNTDRKINVRKTRLGDRLAKAFSLEEQLNTVDNNPDAPQKEEQENTILKQIEWAIALASNLLKLGIDLGFNNEDSPPQMAPREIAIKLQAALQHPDKDLRSAASAVVQAMDIPITVACSQDGIELMCNHLSSL